MAAATLSLSPSCHLFHRLLRPSSLPPPPSSLLSLKPLSSATVTATAAVLWLQSPLRSAAYSRCFLPLHRSSFKPPPHPISASLIHTHSAPKPESKIFDDDDYDDDDDDVEVEDDDDDDDGGGNSTESETQLGKVEMDGNVNESSQLENAKPPPSLTVKEKKELASYAHGLGKKLKTQQVGKSGVTASVVSSFIETLEANELLKLKIHGNCPGELADVVKQLEEATGSVVVGQIGRTVILYRPSLAKLKAEEKKKQARRVSVKSELKAKPALPKKDQVRRPSTRGRRGNSRFSTR